MRFGISEGLFGRFPDYVVGVLMVGNLRNKPSNPDVAGILREAEARSRAALGLGNLRSEPALAIWRERFEAAGMNPNKYRVSVEALLSRVLKGDDLPGINALVDLVNAVSLKYMVPAGAHDVSVPSGDVWVREGTGNESFVPIGAGDPETVPEGEIVYADDAGVRTRRWVWRQAERSKVHEGTGTALVPIDGFAGATDGAVRAAVSELAALVTEHLGADVEVRFLDKSNPVADFGGVSHGAFHPGGGEADPIEGLLERNVVDIVSRADLEKRLRSGETLRVKFGIDPTGPRIHIGRAVPLRKLRQFQELGHRIVLIIGDFTAMIGDASDKTAARRMLTPAEVEANMRDYIGQVSRILDIDGVEFHYNSEWLGKLGFADVVGLASNFTVAQMLERENFSVRYAQGKPIGLQEFMYPLMQGYDSVMIKADVELGGTDQLFNLMAGRELQRVFGQRPQDIMCTRLIPGTDGRKMSTSWGNTITILDEPTQQYGKLMSISDDLITTYLTACTDVSMQRVRELDTAMEHDGLNPINTKKELAFAVVSLYHGREAAAAAQDAFERTVQNKEQPEDIPSFPVIGEVPLLEILVSGGICVSKGDARRLVEQGGIAIDGERVTDTKALVSVPADGERVLKAGKRKYLRLLGPR